MHELLRACFLLGGAWSLVHLVHQRSARSSSARPPTSTLTVAGLSLHWSTTRLNSLPARILNPLQSKLKDDTAARWRTFWDAAALVGLAGVLVAQAVLVWATWASVRVLVLMAFGPKEEGEGVVGALVRRTIERRAAGGGAADLVLRPMIPGVTLPLSSLPLLILALFVAQSFHELGHALAAACESIPLLSTGVHLWVALPTFYVSLPSATQSSPTSELRIATAGVWHNLILVAFYWLLSEQGAALGRTAASPAFRAVDGGVLVVSVDSTSPLAPLLSPSTLLTHLNDLELDSSSSPALLWASYLSKSPSSKASYENMGWCLPSTPFTPSPTACCTTAAEPTAQHELCFALAPHASSTSTKVQETACLDPLPFFPPSKVIPPRCLESTNCPDGLACARPRGSEKVLRIGVTGKDGIERTVVWQGERRGILAHVTVSDVVPKLFWIPLWLPRTLEAFYSNTISLSLALAFFNLLPLPRLDGSAILLSFLRCVHAQPQDLAMEEGVRSPVPELGLLANVVGIVKKGRWLERVGVREGEGERVVRGVERWTLAVAGLVGVCSLVVELCGG